MTHTEEFITAQLIPADPRLTEVLRHIYCVRQSAQAPAAVAKQLVPNYEMMLLLNFGPALSCSLGDKPYVVQRTAVVGPLQKVLHYDVPPGADFMVVVFVFNGFHRLVGKPMHEFWEEDTGGEPQLDETGFEELWEQLQAMPSLADRVELLNEYTVLHLTPTGADATVMLDGSAYFGNPAIDPVKVLAETRHLSTRSVQNRFQTNLGFSAKELARFLRFKKVAATLVEQYPAPPDWADLVFTHGYHDQSHLIKDFQQFMAMTPTDFVKRLADHTICISKPGVHY